MSEELLVESEPLAGVLGHAVGLTVATAAALTVSVSVSVSV